MSPLGLLVVLAVVTAATAFELIRRRRRGRLREVGSGGPGKAGSGGQQLSAETIGGELGDRATLVQFSSAFCRPCVATRRVLTDVAERVPGVRHVDVDAESHLELVRLLGIASTPTTLLLDSDGVVRRQAVGLPRREEVLAALADVVG